MSSEHPDAVCIWVVKGVWYSALVFSISSIAAAAQLLTIIHRLEVYPGGLKVMRRLLGESTPVIAKQRPPGGSGPSGVLDAKLPKKVLWQIPVILLNGSLYLFTAGLCVLVYWEFARAPNYPANIAQVSNESLACYKTMLRAKGLCDLFL
jgi:hypothetical protein